MIGAIKAWWRKRLDADAIHRRIMRTGEVPVFPSERTSIPAGFERTTMRPEHSRRTQVTRRRSA